MEYYNNILCIEAKWLYGDGQIMSESNYKLLKHRSNITLVRRGGNGHTALVAYDSIPDRFKQAIKTKMGGDPHVIGQQNMLMPHLKRDSEAFTYYSEYMLPDSSFLAIEKVNQYTTNASVLNAVDEFIKNTNATRKKVGGTPKGLWETASRLVNKLDKTEWPHTLPANHRRLRDKSTQYKQNGYDALIHGGFCNSNTRKVNELIERIILSLYIAKNKPYAKTVHDYYMRFIAGMLEVVDIETGEMYDRSQFVDKKGGYLTLSEATVWNIINNPDNRTLVDSFRSGRFQFQNIKRPHHHRHMPEFSLSKLSLDDRDLPRKLKDGSRVKAYYAYDVMSQVLLGVAHSRTKDRPLFVDCMRDMFRFLDRENMGLPMEMEVEHHLVNTFRDDLMKAGVVFPFVHWCVPGNSQEKYAEVLNGLKKKGFEKLYQVGVGRFYSKSEAYRVDKDKIFDASNDNYKEKTYTFDELVADDLFTIEKYNNALHSDQKKFPGKTRLEVLRENLNPNLAKPNKPLVTRYIGDRTNTTIRRTQYVTVQHAKYQIPSPEIMAKLQPNNYSVNAYYIPELDGEIKSVYLWQNDEFIGEAAKITTYNRAKSEWTDADEETYKMQSKFVNKFDSMVKEKRNTIGRVEIIENEKAEDFQPEEAEMVETTSCEPDDTSDFNVDEFDIEYYENLGKLSL